jgi:hypothetical protein
LFLANEKKHGGIEGGGRRSTVEKATRAVRLARQVIHTTNDTPAQLAAQKKKQEQFAHHAACGRRAS